MEVRACSIATFARWVPQLITAINPISNSQMILVGNVQIQDHPTGLLVSIPVHVNDQNPAL
jgi:hypothetical protein